MSMYPPSDGLGLLFEKDCLDALIAIHHVAIILYFAAKMLLLGLCHMPARYRKAIKPVADSRGKPHFDLWQAETKPFHIK